MKLNPDCVRDILLVVESASFGERLTLEELSNRLPKYPLDDLHYTCLKLKEGNYVNISTINSLGCLMPQILYIGDLTIVGHDFLDNIKSDTVWQKTKSKACKVGSYSLSVLKVIAVNVLSDLIKSSL